MGPEQLARVLCDTNFLIRLATSRIKNISSIDTEIGQLEFVVPTVVLEELDRLAHDPKKAEFVIPTIQYAQSLDKIEMKGGYADGRLVEYVAKNGGIIATLDKDLKSKIKERGGSIISLSNDKIVLEQ